MFWKVSKYSTCDVYHQLILNYQYALYYVQWETSLKNEKKFLNIAVGEYYIFEK